MKDFAGVVQMQVDSLLETLRRQQATRCQEISQVTGQRARQLIKAARRQSRDRMHQAVAEERQRVDAALLQARGRRRTQERKSLQQHYQGLLEEGWALVEASMQARWEDPQRRRAWCESLAADAVAVFGNAPLLVEHPPGWHADDQTWLTQHLREASAGDPTFKVDASIGSGLRVRTRHACLDGTLEGLLGDRREVEAIFLAAWEQAASKLSGQEPADAGRDSEHG